MSNPNGGGQSGIASASVTALGFGALYLYQQRHSFQQRRRKFEHVSGDSTDPRIFEVEDDNNNSSNDNGNYSGSLNSRTTPMSNEAEDSEEVTELFTVYGPRHPDERKNIQNEERDRLDDWSETPPPQPRRRSSSTPRKDKKVGQSYLNAVSKRQDALYIPPRRNSNEHVAKVHSSKRDDESTKRRSISAFETREQREPCDEDSRRKLRDLNDEIRDAPYSYPREERIATRQEKVASKREDDKDIPPTMVQKLDFLRDLKKMHEQEIDRIKQKSKDDMQAFLNELNAILLDFCGGDTSMADFQHIDFEDLKYKLDSVKSAEAASSAERQRLKDEVDSLRIKLENIQARAEAEKSEMLKSWEVEKTNLLRQNDMLSQANDTKLEEFKKEASRKLEEFKKEARSKFQNDMQRLRDELKELVSGTESLKAEKNGLVLETKSLKKKLKMTEEANRQNKESSLKEIRELKSNISKSEAAKKQEIESFLVDKVEITTEKSNLESKLAEVEAMKNYAEEKQEKYLIQTEVLKSEIARLTSQKESATMSYKALETKMAKMAKTHDQETEQIAKKAEVEKEALQLESKNLLAEVGSLKTKVSEVEKAHKEDQAKLSAENQNLLNISNELKAQVSEVTARSKKEIKELAAEKDALSAKVVEVEAKVVEAHKEKEALTNENGTLKNNLVEAEAGVRQLQTENDTLSKRAESLEAKLLNLESKNEEQRKEIENMETERKESSTKTADLEAKITEYLTSISNMEETHKCQMESKENEISMSTTALEDRITQIEETHQREITKMEETHKREKDQIIRLSAADKKGYVLEAKAFNAEKKELTSKMESITAKFSEIEETHKQEVANFMAQTEELKFQISEVEGTKNKELDRLVLENEEIAVKRDILQLKLAEAEDESASLKATFADAENAHQWDIEQLMGENEKLSTTAKDLENKILSMEEEYEKEIARITVEQKSLQLECDGIRDTKDLLLAESETLKKRLEESDKEVAVKKKLAAGNLDLLVKNKELNTKLTDSENTRRHEIKQLLSDLENIELTNLLEMDRANQDIQILMADKQELTMEINKLNAHIANLEYSKREEYDKFLSMQEEGELTNLLEVEALASAEEHNANFLAEIKILKSAILEAEVVHRHDTERLTKEKAELLSRLEALKDQVFNMEEAYKEVTERITADHTAEKEQLCVEIEELKCQVAEFEETKQQNSSLLSQVEELRGQAFVVEATKNHRIEELSSDKILLTAQLSDANKQNEKLRTETENLLDSDIAHREEVKRYINENEDLSAKISEMETTHEQETDRITAQATAEKDQLFLELDGLKAAKGKLATEIENLKADASDMEEKHRQHSESILKEKQTLLSEVEGLRAQVLVIEATKNQEIESLTAEMEDLTAKVSNADKQNEVLRLDNAALKAQVLQSGSQRILAEKKDLSMKIEALETKLSSMDEMHKEEAERMNMEAMDLKIEKDKLIDERETLKKQITSMEEAHVHDTAIILADKQNALIELDEIKAHVSKIEGAEMKQLLEAQQAAEAEMKKLSAKLVEVETAKKCAEESRAEMLIQMEVLKSQYDTGDRDLEAKLLEAEEQNKSQIIEMEVLKSQLLWAEAESKKAAEQFCDEQQLKSELDAMKDELAKTTELHRQETEMITMQKKKLLEESEGLKTKLLEQVRMHKKDIELALSKNERLAKEKDDLVKEKDELAAKLIEFDTVYNPQVIELDKENTNQENTPSEEGFEVGIKATSLSQHLSELQAQMEWGEVEFEARLKKVHEEHGKELDDVICQLDLVEAEHKASIIKRDTVVMEKDEAIRKLESQLKSQAEQATLEGGAQKQLDALAKQLSQAREDTKSRSEEIERLRANFLQLKLDQSLAQEKACDQVREETIELAERQFEQANEQYRKLKHEFDSSRAKLVALEQETKIKDEATEKTIMEQKTRELELVNELAQMKTVVVKIERETAITLAQFRAELDQRKETETDLRKKLDDEISSSRSVQNTVASIVREKEQLIEENKELKSVCEELMAMVENEDIKQEISLSWMS